VRLGNVIADYRWANRVGVRELAREIGISHPTLNRFERGEKCDSDTLTKILNWLFAPGEERRRKSTE
jgi:DNA-binding Xre family transcriptional regulator